MEVKSCDELDLETDPGVIGTVFTKDLGTKFVNQNEG
jgi:hypothetical protein